MKHKRESKENNPENEMKNEDVMIAILVVLALTEIIVYLRLNLVNRRLDRALERIRELESVVQP